MFSMPTLPRRKRLLDSYRFPRFRPLPEVVAVSSVTRKCGSFVLFGAQKNAVGFCGRVHGALRPQDPAGARSVLWRHAGLSGVRGSAGAVPELRQGEARAAGLSGRQPVLHQALRLLRGPALPAAPIKDVAEELTWTGIRSRRWRSSTCASSWPSAGTPGPQVIGIDEISIRKGHTTASWSATLMRGRPIWFGGKDRSEASMNQFFAWLGQKKVRGFAWRSWTCGRRFATRPNAHAPQAAILYDKFHVMRHLGEALDKVRKSEYARLRGKTGASSRGRSTRCCRIGRISRWTARRR